MLTNAVPFLLVDSNTCTSSLLVLLLVLSPLSMSSDKLYYMEVYLKNAADNGFVNVKVRVYIDNGRMNHLSKCCVGLQLTVYCRWWW